MGLKLGNELKFFTVLMINLIFFFSVLSTLINPMYAQALNISSFSYKPSSPIIIKSNGDFISYASYGDGSFDNPWIIENYSIIELRNSNVY